MWDIWGFASTIAGNEPVRSEDLDIMGSDDSDDEDETGNRWFSDDMPALKKPCTSDEHGRSWFARLSSASTTMLLQLIYVSSKYYDVNGKVVAMSSQSTVNLMNRIPTPGVRGTFPPFPVFPDFTVSQWIPYVLDDDPDPRSEPDPVRSPMEQSVASVMSGQPGMLDRRNLESIVRSDANFIKERTEDIVVAFKKDGGDLSHYTEQDFANIMSYPLAQVYPESIPEFEKLLANASIYGQTQLMIARLDNELKRFSILKRQLQASENSLKADKGQLEKMLMHYEGIQAELDQMSSSWSTTRDEHAVLQRKVAAYEKQPILREFGSAAASRHQFGGPSESPFASPNVSQAYGPPCASSDQ